jgi:hypothetical protein
MEKDTFSAEWNEKEFVEKHAALTRSKLPSLGHPTPATHNWCETLE